MEITKKELQEQINKLQEQLNNFKEPTKFIKGKWYKFKQQHSCIICYQRPGKGYGINVRGNWGDSVGINNDGLSNTKWTIATNEEVEAMLIKEAKKRGFVENVKFLDARIGVNKYTFKSNSCFNLWEDALCIERAGNGTIFCKGKWAEIIKDSKPKVNGYEIEVNGNRVSFGCAKFTRAQLIELKNNIDSFNCWSTEKPVNREIKSIKLDSGVEITVKQLEEITNYLKNE